MKMKKKVLAMALGLGVVGSAFAGQVTPASAEAGWQTVGVDTIHPDASYANNKIVRGQTNTAGGGNYGIFTQDVNVVGTDGPEDQMWVRAYEYDESNSDEYLGQKQFNPTTGDHYTYWDVSAYEDGDNGKAEIYFVYEYNFSLGGDAYPIALVD